MKRRSAGMPVWDQGWMRFAGRHARGKPDRDPLACRSVAKDELSAYFGLSSGIDLLEVSFLRMFTAPQVLLSREFFSFAARLRGRGHPWPIIFLCLLSLLLSACAPMPVRPSKSFIASPNFDERRPNLVIIHHTSNDNVEDALRTLTLPARKVSSHYLIARDGVIIQLVDERNRAWHAGKSWWGGITDVNSVSLGIELDNNGSEPFRDAQIEALLTLLDDIRRRYPIPDANFIGHADVAPTRKDDPSAYFPWKKLAERGFGLWCDEPLVPAPEGFDLDLALAAIGYDPATPEASRDAFRLHFVRGEHGYSDEYEKALAYCVLLKKRSFPPSVESSWKGRDRAASASRIRVPDRQSGACRCRSRRPSGC